MGHLQLMYILGCFCSCFCCAKGGRVKFSTTRDTYIVGDTVTLTCYVRSKWLTVSFRRKNTDLCDCSSIIHGCFSTTEMRDEHINYEFKPGKTSPMLIIKNVTRDEDGIEFTCQWTSYTDTIHFAVIDRPKTKHTGKGTLYSRTIPIIIAGIGLLIILTIILVATISAPVVQISITSVKRRSIMSYARGLHKHVHAPVNDDSEYTRGIGQELIQTNK